MILSSTGARTMTKTAAATERTVATGKAPPPSVRDHAMAYTRATPSTPRSSWKKTAAMALQHAHTLLRQSPSAPTAATEDSHARIQTETSEKSHAMAMTQLAPIATRSTTTLETALATTMETLIQSNMTVAPTHVPILTSPSVTTNATSS